VKLPTNLRLDPNGTLGKLVTAVQDILSRTNSEVNRNSVKLANYVDVKADYGANGDGVTNTQGQLNAAYAGGADALFFPEGTYLVTSKPSGFASVRRAGIGVVTVSGSGNAYPDDDILRYDPNPEGSSDYSIRLTRNRADINADTTKNGFYFYQNYTTSRTTGQVFGYAANVKRSGGGAKVVPAQLNGYAVDGGSSSVWGVATEAWTGDSTNEGTGSASLIAGEFAVHSQYHDNSSPIVGADHVFYLKPGAGGDVLHGSLGNNNYNLNSVAVQISVGHNEGRPATGAYNGWNTGIYFTSNSLDQSTSRKAYGIDMGDVTASRMLAAMRVPKTVPIAMGQPTGGGGIEDGFVYLDSGSVRRIELQRDILGASPVTALILDMSSTGPTGTVMAYDQTGTTVGAAGAASAPPATPALYARIRIGGTNYKIPLYN
jgi:hypothetical protein